MLIGVLIFGALALLPGAWVSFGLPLAGTPRGVRGWYAVALSPFVVAVQFTLGRLVGAPFESLAIGLALINLPAIGLIVWRCRGARPTGGPVLSTRERSAAVGAMLVVAVITGVALMPRVLATEDRALSGHAWMHSDTIDRLAAGQIVPEESLLAGVRQSYPWAGHVLQALVSHAADAAPAAHYLWTNLVWLVVVAGLMVALAQAVGGGALAGAGAVLALFYGVNVLGYVPMKLAGSATSVFGDPRYTPWLLKYPFFNPMPFAFALLAAIALQLVRSWPDRSGSHAALLAISLVALGVVYPLLIPAALALCAVRALYRSPGRRGLIIATVIGVAATWAHLAFVTAERGPGALAGSSWEAVAGKLVTGLVVTLPLILGAGAWATSKAARNSLPLPWVLILGGAASLGAYAALDLPFWRNEYKFVFAAAITWAPFAGVAIERIARARGRLGAFVFAALAIAFALPLAHKTYGSPHWGAAPARRLRLDTSSFELRLDAREPLAALCAQIRRDTPRDAILVTREDAIHYPTVTGRAFYAPPRASDPLPPHVAARNSRVPPFGSGHPGLNLDADYLIRRVRGYDPALIDRRRGEIDALFGADDAARRSALEAIRALGRPIVVIASRERDAGACAWLTANPRDDVHLTFLP